MNKTAIIIPSRLKAERFPNKPLKLINKKEMILHVYDAAKNSKAGDVYVATPDKEIAQLVTKYGGSAIITSNEHQTGTDRIYEVFSKFLNHNPNIIVNLQGDMPNIEPKVIKDLILYMEKGKCDIGTLISKFNSIEELQDQNAVKAIVKEKMDVGKFCNVLDFIRTKPQTSYNLYHHIGIYAFTNKALLRYVNLERSKLEIERNLEQLRAMENNMSIHAGYVNSLPLSVDTEKDFLEIKKVMEKNDKN